VNNTQDDVRIDFINSQAGFTLIPCFDALPSPCSHSSAPEVLTDRGRDVSAIIDALPTWFGDRADISRVGVLGHSRGTHTAFAAAGGSTTYEIPKESRVKAIMGLADGGAGREAFKLNLQDVTVPALLLAGGLDTVSPVEIDLEVFATLGSTEKAFVLIPNAKHRHYDSGLCAQAQSSGTIAAANPRAILDLHTFHGLVIVPSGGGVAMDTCRFETFTDPTDIRPLVASLTGFNVTPDNVPTTGLDSDQLKEKVIALAVIFFGHVLERDSDDNRPFTDFLP
jgi:predicted dienelactone hydrolase